MDHFNATPGLRPNSDPTTTLAIISSTNEVRGKLIECIHSPPSLCTCSGLKSVVTDYIRPVVFGKVVPPLAQALLLAVTLLTAAGLFQFIQNDIGIAKAVKRMWAIKGASSSNN